MTLHRLLNELGHEIKNKIGIVGSTIADLSQGLTIDDDTLEDCSEVYRQLVLLARVLTLNSSSTNTDEHTIETCHQFFKNLFNLITNQNELLLKSSQKNQYFLRVKINDTPVESFPLVLTEQSSNRSVLGFLSSPKNSLEVIYKLLIELQFQNSKLKNLKLSLIDEKNSSLITEYDLPNKILN